MPNERSPADDLRGRWQALTAPFGPHAAELGGKLLRRWAEPHRRYHDVHHLAAVLAHVDELAADGGDLHAVRLAAWYHDAVYAGRPDDEERSAALAGAELPRLGMPADRVAEVARLVRLTASHEPAPADLDGAVLCDADLAILAAPAPDYQRYVAAVRTEYAHLPEPEFRAGRAAVLEKLAARPTLFSTPTGRGRWEDLARANLVAELRALGRRG